MNVNHQTQSHRWIQFLPAGLLAVALVGFAGCQTTGYQKSDAAALNSQVAATHMQAEGEALAATLTSLNDLIHQPATDAKPQFVQFSAALDRLHGTAKQAAKSLDHIGRKRAAYFKVWDKEIAALENEEIRQRSQARRAEVNNQFDATRQQCDEAQNGLLPLIAYLQDLRKALSTDLTRNGLIAAQPSLVNANERARQVQTDLTEANAALDALSARTSSSRVQDAK